MSLSFIACVDRSRFWLLLLAMYAMGSVGCYSRTLYVTFRNTADIAVRMRPVAVGDMVGGSRELLPATEVMPAGTPFAENPVRHLETGVTTVLVRAPGELTLRCAECDLRDSTRHIIENNQFVHHGGINWLVRRAPGALAFQFEYDGRSSRLITVAPPPPPPVRQQPTTTRSAGAEGALAVLSAAVVVLSIFSGHSGGSSYRSSSSSSYSSSHPRPVGPTETRARAHDEVQLITPISNVVRIHERRRPGFGPVAGTIVGLIAGVSGFVYGGVESSASRDPTAGVIVGSIGGALVLLSGVFLLLTGESDLALDSIPQASHKIETSATPVGAYVEP